MDVDVTIAVFDPLTVNEGSDGTRCVVHVERHFGQIDHLSTAKFTSKRQPFLIHCEYRSNLSSCSLSAVIEYQRFRSTGRKTMKGKIHFLTEHETKDLSFIFLSFRPLISA